MATFDEFCPARKAGRLISNGDIDIRGNLAIAKFAERTKSVQIPLVGKPGISSVLVNSVWGAIPFVNAGTPLIDLNQQIPDDYSSGTLLIEFAWVGGGTSGDVKWDLDTNFLTNGDALTNEAQSVTVTVAEATTVIFSAFPALTAPTDGVLAMLKAAISRDSGAGADTSTNTANILSIWLTYTGRA